MSKGNRLACALVVGAALCAPGWAAASADAGLLAGLPVLQSAGAASESTLRVVSSQPDQVSGGDARIAHDTPRGHLYSLYFLNGRLTSLDRIQRSAGRVEGLITGLDLGENTLNVFHVVLRGGIAAIPGGELTLVNHPITGPMFSGPHQQPFVCTVTSEFGIQPLVDSLEPPGFRVFDEDGEVIGYSTNCSIEPFTVYEYRTTAGGWAPWPADGSRPDNVAMTTTIDGEEVDFVVRVERGTINRFIYSHAMLVDPAVIGTDAAEFDTSRWNGRLLYHFQGGVGIGHTQGRWARGAAMDVTALGLGHAIAYSTGNRTGEHYNLEVGGETALMTKEHFVKRFGEPLYTVGLGGSGGGIQQLVYGQNHPGLLDAAIPQVTYPDMVTQTIHVGDCELLEHFMDATDRDNPRWQTTTERSLLVGFNATDLLGNPFGQVQQALGFSAAPGMTECVPAWRGLSPLALNPNFGQARNAENWEPLSDIFDIEWTHMDDLRHIYGIGEDGFARRAVDNVGVQYGLQGLVRGDLSVSEFLKLNFEVGGWKPSAELVQEGFPFIGSPTPENFDPWSRRNIMLSNGDDPAPRHVGDLEAIAALYERGQVFLGQIDIPVLDTRPWLEPVLDMHNSHQSFAVRQRILNQMGEADHHVVWFAGIGDAPPYPMVQFNFPLTSLMVMDEWMLNILENPEAGIVANRPAEAVDACFDFDGTVIAAGEGVWSGILDDEQAGPCTQRFPVFTTSRIEAGGPITGDVFKCHLKSVDTALADGTYGDVMFSDEEQAMLRRIFPDGVCDYSRGDMGRPAHL